MFLRLNRGSITNIFNLDNVTNIFISSSIVSLEFVDKNLYFAFYKEQQPEEYESLKVFFENKLEAYTQAIDILNPKLFNQNKR